MLARNRFTRLVAQVLVLALVLGLLPAPAQAALPSPSGVPAAPPDLPLSDSVPAVLLVAVAIVDGAPCSVVVAVLTPSDPINYHRARWMDPRVGRFLGVDPFEGNEYDPPTLHRYTYGRNDPLNRIDPTGLSEFTIGGLVTSMVMSGTINAIANINPEAPYSGLAHDFLRALQKEQSFTVREFSLFASHGVQFVPPSLLRRWPA